MYLKRLFVPWKLVSPLLRCLAVNPIIYLLELFFCSLCICSADTMIRCQAWFLIYRFPAPLHYCHDGITILFFCFLIIVL